MLHHVVQLVAETIDISLQYVTHLSFGFENVLELLQLLVCFLLLCLHGLPPLYLLQQLRVHGFYFIVKSLSLDLVRHLLITVLAHYVFVNVLEVLHVFVLCQ